MDASFLLSTFAACSQSLAMSAASIVSISYYYCLFNVGVVQRVLNLFPLVGMTAGSSPHDRCTTTFQNRQYHRLREPMLLDETTHSEATASLLKFFAACTLATRLLYQGLL
uniref:Putative secreted protein n=1 Tax=Amblyomma tuberculatum TaxID=48802 RepID=A0A6M2E4W5_9ACAR